MEKDPKLKGYKSYIMSAYVDFIQASGARVVPIDINDPREVTIEKLKKINGVFFPGGSGDYYEYGKFVYQTVKEINDNGTYLPIWGTCLGFEALVVYAAEEDIRVLDKYYIPYGSLSLEFVKDPRQTQMYGWLQDEAYFYQRKKMLYNSHHFGANPEKFETDPGLKETFEVTAVSRLEDGSPFVASIEGKKYPFYGT